MQNNGGGWVGGGGLCLFMIIYDRPGKNQLSVLHTDVLCTTISVKHCAQHFLRFSLHTGLLMVLCLRCCMYLVFSAFHIVIVKSGLFTRIHILFAPLIFYMHFNFVLRLFC